MNTALLLATVAPLQARLKEIEGENDKARMDIDRLSEICIGLDNQIKANDLERTEISDLISKISGEKKGYAPSGVYAGEDLQADETEQLMTIRAAARTWFVSNNNKAIPSRQLAENIGKKKGSTASVLSNHPEFVCNGDGTWQLSSSFYKSGHVTIGR